LKLSHVVQSLIKQRIGITDEVQRGLVEIFPDSAGLLELKGVLDWFVHQEADGASWIVQSEHRPPVLSLAAAFIDVLDLNGECLGATARWPAGSPPVRPDGWSIFAPYTINLNPPGSVAIRLSTSVSTREYFRGRVALRSLLDAMRTRPADVVRATVHERGSHPVIIPVGHPTPQAPPPPPLSTDVRNGTITLYGNTQGVRNRKAIAFVQYLISADGHVLPFSEMKTKPDLTPESSLKKENKSSRLIKALPPEIQSLIVTKPNKGYLLDLSRARATPPA